MKTFRHLFTACIIGLLVWSCASAPKKIENSSEEKPVVIANDSLEYEIIIFDIGYTNYLNTIAQPVGFYSQGFLENKNQNYVTIWNMRASNPARYNPNIYENIIDYDPNVDYGYDVNYKLFNYFEFAQRKYRMRLR